MLSFPLLLRRALVPVAAALAFAGLLSAESARAAYPERPIRIVAPFPPGGGVDLVSRHIGSGLNKEFGQPVVIDNRPGAGTIIGTDIVAKSPADGYTLVMSSFAHAVNPSLYDKLPYSDKALTPVVLVARSFNILVVHPNSAYKTVPDLLAFARANPAKLTYGSFGNGTSGHLAGELFASLAKVDLVHVPYRGSSLALTDLLGGRLDMMFATTGSAGPMIRANRLRPLAITLSQRAPMYPELPTLAEAGVPKYAAEAWYGIYAPAGTPRPIIDRLNSAVKKVVHSEEYRKSVESEGLIPAVGTPEDMGRYVAGEQARWHAIVKQANIKPD